MPLEDETQDVIGSPRAASDFRREEVFPLRLLLITSGAIAVAEAIIHTAMTWLPPMDKATEGFVDGLVTLLFMFPVFYWFSYHPLTRAIERQRRAEVALKASERQYRAIVEDQTEFIVRISPEGSLTFVNAALSRFLGKDFQALNGERACTIFPQIDEPEVASILAKLSPEHPVATAELCYSGGAQEDAWILWTVRAICDEDSTPTSYQAVGRDITQQKLVHEQLERAHSQLEERVEIRTLELIESNASLKAEIDSRQKAEAKVHQQATALEAAANGIIITWLDGTIQWCNPAFSRMTGYAIDEVLGKKIAILNSGRHEREFYRQLWETVLSGNVWRGEMINRRKDGTLYYEEQTITPVFDAGSQLTSFIAIKQDVTLRKRAEEDIKRRNWELGALNVIGNAVGSSLEMDEVTYTLRNILSDHFGFPRGKIFSYNADDRCFQLQASWGISEERVSSYLLIPLPGQLPDEKILDPEGISRYLEQELISKIPAALRNLYEDEQTICLPLLAQNKLQGALVLSRGEGGKFDSIDPGFYNTLANQVGAAVQNIRLYKAEAQARQTAETLRGANQALSQSLNLETVLITLLDFLRKLVPFEVGQVLLMEDETHLVARSDIGRAGPTGSAAPIVIDITHYPVFETVFTTRRSMCISNTDLLVEWRPLPGDQETRSWLGIPLITGERVIGIVSLEVTRKDCFSDDHLELAEALVGQAAIAVQNAWLFEQVRSGRERLQTLSRRLVEVQETERRYIARELHDEASQILIYLKYGLDLLKRDAHQPEAVVAGIDELDRMASEVLDNLRRIAVDLRPASLDHLGLVPALRQYIEAVSDKHGLKVQFETRNVSGRLPNEVETSLYRIVQEALTNIVRHANAARVDILLDQNGDTITVGVEDNGIGFDPIEAMGRNRLGLFGMRERAEMLGGRLLVESQSGTGTSIMVEIPNANSHPNR
jgi:PAS domain S-box-containing protein